MPKPYSDDLRCKVIEAVELDGMPINEIEHCWPWLKSRIRRDLDNFETLRDAMEHVLKVATSRMRCGRLSMTKAISSGSSWQ